LTVTNRWTYLYAFGGTREFQGSDHIDVHVSDGLHLNQCRDDDTNCPKGVDFAAIDFAGHESVIVYLGPNGGEIRSTTAMAEATPFPFGFTATASGFSANSTMACKFIWDGQPDPTAGCFGASSDGYGNVYADVSVPTLDGSGTLTVEITDERHPGLSAIGTYVIPPG
jgi:hypothetical protein